MPKKYVVRLTEAEREHLERLVRKGKAHARKLLYGRILLKADANKDSWTDERIAEAFEVSTATVARERRRYCEDGLEVALMPKKPGRPRRRVLDGRAGGASDRSGLLGASEGEETLECASSGRAFRGAGERRRAHLPRVGPAHSQKSAIKPWLKGQWSIPPKQDASFVWRMEDVLEVYTRPYDERDPRVSRRCAWTRRASSSWVR